MAFETELGREVRQNVARILKRFEGCDIAAVKVVDLQKIDRLINPEPEGFEVRERTDEGAMSPFFFARYARNAEGL